MPENADVISTRWVFAVKENNKGEIERFKARIVARGFEEDEEQKGKTYASTPHYESLRIILCLAVKKRQPIRIIDFKNAFIQSKIDRVVYIDIPDGLEGKG